MTCFRLSGTIFALTLLGVVALPQAARAQASRYYIMSGDDNDRLTIVQGGALVSTTTLAVANQLLYPIAIRNTIWLADRGPTGGSTEVDLNGALTGNSAAYGPGFDQLLDGTTDGAFNYAVQLGGVNSVVRGNLNWTGQAAIFSVPNAENGLGITFDSVSGHLFVSSFSGKTYEMTLGGTVVNTLSVGIKALAYEQVTDSLWGMVTTNQIRQYNKTTGATLQTLTIAGANFGNAFGGEMRLVTSAVGPEPGTLALLALGMVGGLVAKRRK